MPSSQEADAAVSGIAKAIADVCRRELTALLLSPDAAVGDRHLNALDAAVDLVEPLILASRDAAHRGYALRDFDTQAVSDLASAPARTQGALGCPRSTGRRPDAGAALMLIYRTIPLPDKMWYRPNKRVESQFVAGWTATLDLLEREIDYLHGDDVRLAVDVPASSIRNDGMIKVGALTYSPGVVLMFETRDGEMSFRSDRFVRGATTGFRTENKVTKLVTKMVGDWQHNVRAIALGMEALRTIRRYGIADDDQQYSGFKALNAGTGIAASAMTASSAQVILIAAAEEPWTKWPDQSDAVARLVKAAKRNTHPDAHGGDHGRWVPVEEAIRVLTRAGKIQ